MTLTKKQREELRMMFGGKCAYCGCDLPKGWHADHVEPVLRVIKWQRSTEDKPGRYVATGEVYKPENQRVNNFFPSCPACNIDKSATPLEDWREWLQYRIVTALRNNSSTFRHAERFGRVTINPAPLVFWFERYATSIPASSEVSCGN